VERRACPPGKDQGIGEQGQFYVGYHEVPAVWRRQERHTRFPFDISSRGHRPGDAAKHVTGPLGFGPLLESDHHPVAIGYKAADGFFGFRQIGYGHLAAGRPDAGTGHSSHGL
jgi:hypothetical protein